MFVDIAQRASQVFGMINLSSKLSPNTFLFICQLVKER
jgi:hypothetical protein